MSQNLDHTVGLQLSARVSFLPVITRYVEAVAKTFGMPRVDSLKLSLATEEIFSYLSSNVCRGEMIDLCCLNKLSYIRVEFRFSVSTLNMGALNIAAFIPCAHEDDMDEMGLLIASRIIDRLNIITEGRNRICLVIEKDKIYPPVTESAIAPADETGALIVETPDNEGIKRYVTRLAQEPPDLLRPSFFKYPGKVVDMVAAGECQVLTVVDNKGECAGGVIFRFRTPRNVEIFCPHIFYPTRADEIANLLFDACIARTVRTKAIGLVNLTGMPSSIQSQFELLGLLTYSGDDGTTFTRPWHYRLLHEDTGSLIYTDTILKDYLQREFSRLFLVRNIREVSDHGEQKAGASIFSAEVHQEGSIATLHPLWPGRDFDENVKRHLRFLQGEGIRNIFFNLDLGISWHASLMSVLINNHYRPALILPFAGQADLVIFQYDESES